MKKMALKTKMVIIYLQDLGVPEDSIIMVHFTDADDGGHCPKFILFLDHEVKSVVLAIRGTFSPKDIILDAVAEEVPFLDGMAHKGILSGSKIILDKVLDSIISNLRMFPGNYIPTVTCKKRNNSSIFIVE